MIVSVKLARATEGAALNSPAKLFGFKMSPESANSEITVPPIRNRATISSNDCTSLQMQSMQTLVPRAASILSIGAAMAKNNKQGVDLTQLKPLDAKDEEMIRVVIETPKGSRNKYAFDPKEKIFLLKKVLPAGMIFPYDFGFVPQTEADDGDPIDVMVLMDEPAFPGCVLKCRPIGVMEGEQGEKNDWERNDRIIAIEEQAHSFADIKTIDDLGKQFCRELAEFFVNYHRLTGKEYRVLTLAGKKTVYKLIQSARQ